MHFEMDPESIILHNAHAYSGKEDQDLVGTQKLQHFLISRCFIQWCGPTPVEPKPERLEISAPAPLLRSLGFYAIFFKFYFDYFL